MRVLYMEQAQKMKAAGSLLEAEKLYLQVGEVTTEKTGVGGSWEKWRQLYTVPTVKCRTGYVNDAVLLGYTERKRVCTAKRGVFHVVA